MHRALGPSNDIGRDIGPPDGRLSAPLLEKLERAGRLLEDIGHDLDLQPYGPPADPVPPGLPPRDSIYRPDFEGLVAAIHSLGVGRRPGIRIGGLEMTQSMQYFNYDGLGTGAGPDNSIPLVANKTLVLRVYVEIRPNAGYVPARVTARVRFAGQNFAPTGGGPRQPREGRLLRRASLSDTLNFRIPATLCRGTRTFQVTAYDADADANVGAGVGIRIDGSVVPFSSTTETFVASFQDVPPMRVCGVLVNYAGPGFDLPAPVGTNLVDTLVRFLPMFPIQGFDFGPCVQTTWGDDMRIEAGNKWSGWDSLLNYITNLRNASTVPAIYVGLLPPNLTMQLGIGQRGIGRPGVAIASQDDTRAMSHELGHAAGLSHVNAGGAPPPFDTNYPKYRDGNLPFGTVGEVGIDSALMSVFPPGTSSDLMTYQDNPNVLLPPTSWISPYHYQRMLYSMIATNGTGDIVATATIAAAAMLLNFRLYRDRRVELLPSYVVTGARTRDRNRAPRPVMIDVIGRNGDVLSSHRCREHNSYQDIDGPFIDFNEVLPWSDEVAGLAFVREGEVVHTIDVEKHHPEIELGDFQRVERSGDLARLKWETRSHGGQVQTMVRYSHDDGRTWQALAAGLTDSSHLVDLAFLPGGERCRLQVIVSSGLRSAVATTEPFAVAHKRRQAHLCSPHDGQVFRAGAPVTFVGGGYSPDGGTCPMNDVAWHSNLDGLLGTGVHVVRDDLRPGAHRIALSMPDGARGEAAASVWIRIAEDGDTGEDCPPSAAHSGCR